MKTLLSIVLFAGLLVPAPSHGDLMVPVTLENLIDGAERIFRGRVESVAVERAAPGSPTVRVTRFLVLEALKGPADTQVEVRQMVRRRPGGSFHPIVGPSFDSGKEYVVFRSGESGRGFSSTVGLAQGVFLVRHGRDGEAVAQSAFLPQLMRADSFEGPRTRALVESLVGPRKGMAGGALDLRNLRSLVSVRLEETR